jgi:hypothetical protein
LFETFPIPDSERLISKARECGKQYYSLRQEICQRLSIGLTQVYNRFNDLEETAIDVQKLRDIYVEMDKAVAAA